MCLNGLIITIIISPLSNKKNSHNLKNLGNWATKKNDVTPETNQEVEEGQKNP